MKNLIARICKILHIHLSDEKLEGLTQFVKFGIVGVTNTLLSYIIYLLVLFLMKPLELSWDLYVASVVGFILSVLWSFYWNNRYVFASKDKNNPWWKKLLKTYLSYALTGIVLANLLLYFWVSVLGISKVIAPLLSLVITVPLNFVLNKFWAFRSRSDT